MRRAAAAQAAAAARKARAAEAAQSDSSDSEDEHLESAKADDKKVEQTMNTSPKGRQPPGWKCFTLFYIHTC